MHKAESNSQVKARAQHRLIGDEQKRNTASRHEPDTASRETKKATARSRHEPDTASRETKRENTASRHAPDTASGETKEVIKTCKIFY